MDGGRVPYHSSGLQREDPENCYVRHITYKALASSDCQVVGLASLDWVQGLGFRMSRDLVSLWSP